MTTIGLTLNRVTTDVISPILEVVEIFNANMYISILQWLSIFRQYSGSGAQRVTFFLWPKLVGRVLCVGSLNSCDYYKQ